MLIIIGSSFMTLYKVFKNKHGTCFYFIDKVVLDEQTSIILKFSSTLSILLMIIEIYGVVTKNNIIVTTISIIFIVSTCITRYKLYKS